MIWISGGDQKRTALAYEQLIPVLIEAMKEQQAQIDALKLEINPLKQKR